MLQLKKIHYRIGSKSLVNNVSFHAEPGDMVAFLGANGAGKSSLIKIISREWQGYEGEVLWNGLDQKRVKAEISAKYRAVLTQNIHVSGDLSVKEIVMMGRYPHFSRKPAHYDFQVVDEMIHSCEIDHLREKPYQQLSGGEKQRVQLARVLCQLKEEKNTGPKLLLLDEPLNNLDVRYQQLCMQHAKAFAEEGNIVVMVIHDINMALRYSTHLLLMKQGQMLGFGRSIDLMDEQLFEECYDLPVRMYSLPGTDVPHVFFEENETVFNRITNKINQRLVSTI